MTVTNVMAKAAMTVGILLLTRQDGLAQLSGASVSSTGSTCTGGSTTDGDCRFSVGFATTCGASCPSFTTRYAWNLSADTNAGLTRDASGAAQHNVSFNATAPGGYRLDITTSRVGDLRLINDAAGCSGSADTSGTSGSSNIALSSGTLTLADPGVINTTGSDTDTGFNQPSSAVIFRLSNGVSQAHSLSFTWTGSVRSNSCEAAIRQGESSGSTSGCSACGYPGTPSRTQSSDGHFVTVTFTSLCGNGTIDAAVGEDCDTGIAGSDCCDTTCRFKANGAACTSDGNPCSLDQCDGTSAGCTHTSPAPAGTVCRQGSNDVCDPTETCTGSSTACPADVVQPSTVVCRSATGVCDAVETCPGVPTESCPADALQPASTVCRSTAGVCDVAETCDGSATTCPADVLHSTATACRPSTGDCDPEEFCPGNGPNCPADVRFPAGTSCASDGNPCTLDQCDGTNGACQHPVDDGAAACGGGAHSRCAGWKIAAAGKKAAARARCHAKAIGKDALVDGDCLAKTEKKFTAACVKAERFADCLGGSGDASAIELRVDDFIDDVVSALRTGSGESVCTSRKVTAAGKKARSKAKCHAKAIAKGLPAVDGSCLGKAETKFTKAFAKADLLGDCQAGTGDADAIEMKVDALIADLVAGLTGQLTPTTTSTTSTTLVGEGCCDKNRVVFTSDAGSGMCGSVRNGAGTTILDIIRGALYAGGGLSSIIPPAELPDGITMTLDAVSCDPGTGTIQLAGTQDNGDNHRQCTTAGCQFAPPISARRSSGPGQEYGACLVTTVSESASGTLSCLTGELGVTIGLSAFGVLTADQVPDGQCSASPFGACAGDIDCTPGTCILYGCNGGLNNGAPCTNHADCPGGFCPAGFQGCPLCAPDATATGPRCQGGPNSGQPCTPTGSAIGPAFPTSPDCPPDSSGPNGTLPIPMTLGTGAVSETAVSTGSQLRVFCGYCRDADDTYAFSSPPIPCVTDADCSQPYEACQQSNSGAFAKAAAAMIEMTGAPGGDLRDGTPHPTTLVGSSCIPPTSDQISAQILDVPGPAAVTISGSVTLTTVSTTTTTTVPCGGDPQPPECDGSCGPGTACMPQDWPNNTRPCVCRPWPIPCGTIPPNFFGACFGECPPEAPICATVGGNCVCVTSP